MRKLPVYVLTLVAALLLSVTAFAQDATTVPGTGEREYRVDIGEIVGNADSYYGSSVSLEGNIIELVNVKTFILDDGAALATNQVIVINNTGYEYPLWVTADNRIRVTGIVHPRTSDGGLDLLMSGGMMATTPDSETTPEATPEMEMMPMDDMERGNVNPLTSEVVPERFYDWVILELTSIEDMTLFVE